MNRHAATTGETDEIDGAAVLALAYLALPNLIFLFGWLRLPLALVMCGAMVWLIRGAIRPGPVAWRPVHSPAALLLIVATAAGWAAFGGGSHFMYANPDWIVRDAVLADLVHAAWPVHYTSPDGELLVMRSAIGFFLPPALFGKLFDGNGLDVAVYLWTALGILVFLLLLRLPQTGNGRLAAGLALVVFFGGMDFLGLVLETHQLPIFPLRLEWWVPLSYSSLSGSLLWAPNHCLPIWIVTALSFHFRNSRRLPGLSCALLPLTLIWTPFAAIGLLPFLLLSAVRYLQTFGWQAMPWREPLVALVFSVPLLGYLLLDLSAISSGTAAQPDARGGYAYVAISLRTYFTFVACEFLLLTLALAPHVERARAYFALATLLLLLLPLVRFGPSNDVMLRLSAAPLVILLLICLQTLLGKESRRPRPTLWLVWLILAIGSHTAFNELWRAAAFNRWRADYRPTLADRQGGTPPSHYAARIELPVIEAILKPMAHDTAARTRSADRR